VDLSAMKVIEGITFATYFVGSKDTNINKAEILTGCAKLFVEKKSIIFNVLCHVIVRY
jgi:hypothetical protein